jgi:hypothetical protein
VKIRVWMLQPALFEVTEHRVAPWGPWLTLRGLQRFGISGLPLPASIAGPPWNPHRWGGMSCAVQADSAQQDCRAPMACCRVVTLTPIGAYLDEFIINRYTKNRRYSIPSLSPSVKPGRGQRRFDLLSSHCRRAGLRRSSVHVGCGGGRRCGRRPALSPGDAILCRSRTLGLTKADSHDYSVPWPKGGQYTDVAGHQVGTVATDGEPTVGYAETEGTCPAER